MQFVKNGPDVPEQLLQAQEDGRVVFFCGAGISYPAGLPGFKGLVDQIYNQLGTNRHEDEDKAYQQNRYDATLDLLEHRIPGQRIAVRSLLQKCLKPSFRRKGATQTHSALLELAKGRDGAVRLVTTNFDRIFQHVIKRDKLNVSHFPAPLLPIPKNSRWDGIVYLHGILPNSHNENALNRLVLSSGDFGLAYLTERWAARFLTELFRNYVVCFVGYSIDDPVLRYMMDALAADRMLGEVTPQAYAFGDYKPGMESAQQSNWSAKGVSPILYRVSADGRDHSTLHDTLKEWSNTYRDGAQGRERIIVDYAASKPMASTKQDDFVGRMLWALSHKSGLPARRFADFDPVPSLDWLEPLCEERYAHSDLVRFGVPPVAQADEKLKFSIVRRPAPYTHSPWMMVVNYSYTPSDWDDVMAQLARWLCRHLDDPALILWLVKHGGNIHERFVWLIERSLETIDRLQSEGKTEEIKRITDSAPRAVPRPMMRTLWRLLITGRVKSGRMGADFYGWLRELKHHGLTATTRLQLRNLLSPRVAIREPFHWEANADAGENSEPTRIRHLVDWDLKLTADHVRHAVIERHDNNAWNSALPLILPDAQQLLRDALDIFRELGEADDLLDRSHWDLSSISSHWQNRGYQDWVALIEIARDSWVSVREADPLRAKNVAFDWWRQPYPTFKRLALFAATHDAITPEGEWVSWVLENDAWWLWSPGMLREVMRLFILNATGLSAANRTQLVSAVLAGPPRNLFNDNVSEEDFLRMTDRMTWLRLAKLSSAGIDLGAIAAERLEQLSAAHEYWKLAENERDEFSHWMSGTGDPDYEEQRQIERAPRDLPMLTQWLMKEPPKDQFFYEDDWRSICRESPVIAFRALRMLAVENQWPSERWAEALQVWSEQKFTRLSWRFAARVLQQIPDDVLQQIAHSLSSWLESVSKEDGGDKPTFLRLCTRLISLEFDNVDDEAERPTQRAINHPIGHVSQALLNYWLSAHPLDNDGLPVELKDTFTSFCDTTIPKFRHARVLLAAHVISLYRVDSAWTETYLLPLFSWQISRVEARAAWDGFFWSPRLYRPLLTAFKDDFLDTANHYGDLDMLDRQYPAFLTYAALDRADTFTPEELLAATEKLPREGLQECAEALSRALEGAGDRSNEYWTNRIEPYWHDVWPKNRDLASPGISKELARLTVAAGANFPKALSMVRAWLMPFDYPSFVIGLLHESGACTNFPQDSLSLLSLIIAHNAWPVEELSGCLTEIVASWPEAINDTNYRRLREIVLRHQG